MSSEKHEEFKRSGENVFFKIWPFKLGDSRGFAATKHPPRDATDLLRPKN